MLTLLGVLGFLAVLLGGFLVVNTISALIGQQIRQIGVMKAIGAKSSQIVVMYLGLIIAYSIVALLVSIPLSSIAGFVFASGFLGFFGFEMNQFRIPPNPWCSRWRWRSSSRWWRACCQSSGERASRFERQSATMASPVATHGAASSIVSSTGFGVCRAR